jgi:hypothetical protein
MTKCILSITPNVSQLTEVGDYEAQNFNFKNKFDMKNKTLINHENEMKGQYVIIDLRNMDFMKNEKGEIIYYDTEDEACTVCGMYEFENAWVMKLIYNHIEAVM